MAVSTSSVLSGCLVQALDYCFRNLFLGAVRGGTDECVSLTSWRVRGLGCFCLWALDLVEVWDGGACVVRLWSHVVASASCLTLLVLRESCVARPWLWVMALLCSAALSYST
ncbi:hypothetical protein Taro_044855, partial [Colocasia esculenta]|nr:hypothetical protein [Colocasia esculenta]